MVSAHIEEVISSVIFRSFMCEVGGSVLLLQEALDGDRRPWNWSAGRFPRLGTHCLGVFHIRRALSGALAIPEHILFEQGRRVSFWAVYIF